MSPQELLNRLTQHWDEAGAALDPEGRAGLLTSLRVLADSINDGWVARKALQDVKNALKPLPLGHPVLRVLDGTRFVATDVVPRRRGGGRAAGAACGCAHFSQRRSDDPSAE
ncbi:hypothetical protein [Streptomyces sp. NBC_01431]|uniref:hypothetical protein n=1 Tax=Streptomyces sp. NBC_01431 TaxID=2903863 RepID=UPI002E323741|nr:hypothetical protein [Streptomyces sp. NBC_01431]